MTKSQTTMTKPQILERAYDGEIRAVESGDGLTLSGYAAVFDTPTRIDSWEGTFDEQIRRGAFSKTIGERMPILQWNHGKDPAIGQVPIGAITALREDDRGLWVEARLHPNDAVRPVRDAIASGAITGMSFRFQAMQQQVDESGEMPLRTLTEVKLFELGPVAMPAYDATTVGVRDVVVVVTDDDDEEGEDVENDDVVCPQCGAIDESTDNYCPNCGAALAAGGQSENATTPKAAEQAPSSAGAINEPRSCTRVDEHRRFVMRLELVRNVR